MKTSNRLSQAAENDIVEALAWSQSRFGEPARRKYQTLISAAIRDIVADPSGMRARPRSELGDGIYSWHLRISRTGSTGRPVNRPRHLLVYRIDEGVVVIARMLHDAIELERHLDAAAWE